MSFQIPKGDQKANYVQSKFTKISEKYDLFNDLITLGMHRYWKRVLVKKAKLKLGDHALDICCGTGDITGRIEGVVGSGGLAMGLDFSKGMLDIAKSRNQSVKKQLICASACEIPYKDNSVHAVTVGFGLRNLVNIKTCLSEVYRVLKPGGRFICLDMGKVKIPIIKQLFQFYFFRIVPIIGRIIYPGEDFFSYFPESSTQYPSQEKLAGLLEEAGFINIHFTNFSFGNTVIHQAVKKE